MPGLFFGGDMAKGNDGNYLQHSVEIEVAFRLARKDPDGRLHIALTHGMAPAQGAGCPGQTVDGNDQDLPLPAGERHAPIRQAPSRGLIAVNLSFIETLALSRS